jgi:hypothetical protein
MQSSRCQCAFTYFRALSSGTTGTPLRGICGVPMSGVAETTPKYRDQVTRRNGPSRERESG